MNAGIYELDDVFKFGKHKGETLLDVIKHEATYVGWCLDNIDGFELSDKAQDFYEAITDESEE